MTLSVAAITFDCHDARKVAEFWSAAFDQPIDLEPPASQFFASIGRSNPDGSGPQMMFINVSESKAIKNRVHLDLQADDRAAEVERLTSLGATHIHDKEEWGMSWTTLADPEGNEFCVATH
ncbi:MAG: VOC family protein [Acidimicrobiales bacterium]